MDQHIRKGENTGFTDRSDRVCQRGTYWYFHTREEVMIGPFDSKELATRGANDYVGFAIDADPALLGSLAE